MDIIVHIRQKKSSDSFLYFVQLEVLKSFPDICR